MKKGRKELRADLILVLHPVIEKIHVTFIVLCRSEISRRYELACGNGNGNGNDDDDVNDGCLTIFEG